MPINANIGNISYVLCALLGAVLATNGFGGLTLGTIVSFCTLNKNFTNPISQLSQQMTFVIMASAGAKRLFDLMDQKPEHDDGYVELVNAEIDENGNITEVVTAQANGRGSILIKRTARCRIKGRRAVLSLTV